MYQVGNYIVYGTSGVCKIENIGNLHMSGEISPRIYYTLSPCYSKGSTIFTPADNQKVTMRPIMSKEEADRLINEMGSIGCLRISDEKSRESNYKEALKRCNCRDLVKVIKTIYSRKQQRAAEGKKMIAADDKYFHIAEDALYGELAVSLGMDREEIKEYIISKIEV